jgi:probable rRNA maturation factor
MIANQPGIIVSDRQRKVRVKLDLLREFASRALGECLKLARQKRGGLGDLPEIIVVLVSDNRIAAIHQEFMNAPDPTDVITFQHGEIFISVETAKRQARAYRTSLEHELRLYLVHGLLHLHGYNDATEAGAAEMKRLQEGIVTKLDDR